MVEVRVCRTETATDTTMTRHTCKSAYNVLLTALFAVTLAPGVM